MDDWQPIETAPRDGTMILLYVVTNINTIQSVAAWQRYTHEDESAACWHQSDGVTSFPPHMAVRWQPLPEAPKL